MRVTVSFSWACTVLLCAYCSLRCSRDTRPWKLHTRRSRYCQHFEAVHEPSYGKSVVFLCPIAIDFQVYFSLDQSTLPLMLALKIYDTALIPLPDISIFKIFLTLWRNAERNVRSKCALEQGFKDGQNTSCAQDFNCQHFNCQLECKLNCTVVMQVSTL